ncbi:hypothetical protein SCMC78_50890 [Streptomyces sp. CMC78]|uniref:Uncharacterized protein n=1 Tax=Streptomyces sp. CMC78 TaxID=3231512 RepID=A0AB33KRS0_9ACTN
MGVAVLVALATRRSNAPAAQDDPLHAATEGFSLALTVTATLLALGAVLIATSLGRSRPPEDVHDTGDVPAGHGNRA